MVFKGVSHFPRFVIQIKLDSHGRFMDQLIANFYVSLDSGARSYKSCLHHTMDQVIDRFSELQTVKYQVVYKGQKKIIDSIEEAAN